MKTNKEITYKAQVKPFLLWQAPKLSKALTNFLLKNVGKTLSGLTIPSFYSDSVWYKDTLVPINVFTGLEEETKEDTLEVLLETPEAPLDVHPTQSTPKDTSEVLEHLETLIEPSKETTQEPFVMSKSKLEKILAKRRTHYVKLTLSDKNISFRFFYESQDNPWREGNWYMVQHNDKQYIKVTYEFVQHNLQDVTEIHEIIGRGFKKQGYLKIIKDLRTSEILEGKNL